MAGLIIFASMIIVVAMFVLIGFTAVGAVISAFDKDVSILPAPALSTYNFLKTVMGNVFPLMATLIIVAAIGAVIAATFGLGGGGREE